MLHPWIKIEDVYDLLQNTPSIDGLISKRDFQKALLKCKEYKQPLEKIEKIKPYKVRNAHEIIGNINKYKRNFKGGVYWEAIKRMQQKFGDLYDEYGTDDEIGFDKNEIEIYEKRGNTIVKIHEKDVVFYYNADEILISILKISRSTLLRWKNLNIIRPNIFKDAIIKIQGKKEIECTIHWYSLNDIKKNIEKHR